MTKDEALRLALRAIMVNNQAWKYLADSGDAGNFDAEEQGYYQLNEQAITSIKAALETKDEPWSPVSIGVDVTQEGTHVMAMRLRPNGVNEVIYSQFHPLQKSEQPKVRTGDCLLVGVCASEGHKIQPQRTWVGLTDEEIEVIEVLRAPPVHPDFVDCDDWVEFARAIESKLKDKNA